LASNIQVLEALRELKKRERISEYNKNFETFAKEQIKILGKDSSKGFQPFLFNSAQRIINDRIEQQLKETGKVRVIILKARQMGVSTYTAARVFWKSYFNSNNKSCIMAHDSSTSDALFTMSRNIIDNMSEDMRPVFQKSNSKEILFEHNNSGYKLFTAGAPEAGRGLTPTICHLSETAFWNYDERILSGLFQGISQANNTEVIIESTANGVGNSFHRLWVGAVNEENDYIPIFVPWFLMDEYQRKAADSFEITVEEEVLIARFGLTNDQLYWRRLKIAESGESKFAQEYPATAEEAFVVSGSNVFNLEKLSKLIPQPILASKEFNQESKMFEDMRRGPLEIYKYPQTESGFAVAGDVSLGVGKDYSCAVVINNQRQVCAVYRSNTIDPSLFGDLLFYLGRYYNNALLAVESNSMGIATLNRLVQMNYVNIYYQTKISNISKEEGTRMGWRTTSASKPAVIGFLKNAIESDEIWIPSRVMISELMSYVSDDTGKTNASSGNNDDTVIALAIALEVIRTHGDKLTTTNVPFYQKVGSYQEVPTSWL